MRVAIFEVEEWERETFRRLGPDYDVQFLKSAVTPANAAHYADADVISTFIYSDLSADVLEQLPNVKLIATRSTGYDHIDLATCEERGIIVCNVPRYGDNTVAEHVFGLLLAISHRLIESVDRTRRGDFSPEGLRGFDLQGKTLGVVGTGHIGRYVIEIAKGYRMNVVAFDARPDMSYAEEMGFRYVDMDELLFISDIITLHVPSTPATHHLLNEDAFARMKDGVVIINTARGDLIDGRALVGALADGKAAAAGLDVLAQEPLIREEAELLRSVFHREHDLENLLVGHILLRMRNVIITPHTAFNTQEAIERILETTVDNIISFANGEPRNVIVGVPVRQMG
ncbi:MAG TPA: hydroxyacid dehydrogenase [Chloroflexi bacterium]|nr:hydroxyacid dehydrogenase [Chloroflexota bacterium]